MRQWENEGHGNYPDFAPLFHLLGRNRAASDPAAAFRWASGLHSEIRPAAIRGVLEAWGEADPAAAWKQAVSLDASLKEPYSFDPHLDAVISALLTRIAKDDPASAVKLMMGIEDRSQFSSFDGTSAMLRQETFAGAFDHANRNLDVPEQMALLQQIPAADRAGAFNAMITRVAGDPVAGGDPKHTRRPETRPEMVAPLLNDLPPSSEGDAQVEGRFRSPARRNLSSRSQEIARLTLSGTGRDHFLTG